jgi:protein-S-isoprenylcysteine O-methyltransferase Ste14
MIEIKQSENSLAIKSVFNWSRNPITVGLHLCLFGLIVIVEQWYLLFGLLFYIRTIDEKIKIEEQYLCTKFKSKFQQYMITTPRYFLY